MPDRIRWEQDQPYGGIKGIKGCLVGYAPGLAGTETP